MLCHGCYIIGVLHADQQPPLHTRLYSVGSLRRHELIVRGESGMPPKLSIQVEANDSDEDISRFEKYDFKVNTDVFPIEKCSKEVVKKHHGNRKNEKIVMENFDSVQFSCGNPSVEQTKGIIHLFKEKGRGSTEISNIICMLSVPTSITCAEVVSICSPYWDHLKNIKILRNDSPNLYLALLAFRTKEYASIFYSSFQGKLLNLNNPKSACILAYVESVKLLNSSKGGFRGTDDQTELPVCAICLERMDESLEGILTVLCDHSFHTECLMKWSDFKCPVCRYTQSPIGLNSLKCGECLETNNLWLCLICGHVGCGRYEQKHAFKHYQETAHTFAMKVGETKVWDYAGDSYVHRLIECVDGKTVECCDPTQENLDEKVDSLRLEYTHLLTQQLRSQSAHYESKLQQERASWQEKIRNLKAKMDVIKEKLAAEMKENKATQANHNSNTEKIKKLQSSLKEEKLLNASLIKNQEQWKKKLMQAQTDYKELEEKSKKRISDLSEQVQDLMRHFEVINSISSKPSKDQEEIKDGDIVVLNKNHNSKSTKKKR